MTTIIQVTLSSFFLSVAVSLKAGGVLFLPAFLGTIQYRFGLLMLIYSLIVIVGWQCLVAAPFVLPAWGGKTPLWTYIQMAKFLGGDGKGGSQGWGA